MPITLADKRLLKASTGITFHLTTDYDGTMVATTVVKGWDNDHKVLVEVEFDRTTIEHYNGHGENLTGYVHTIGGGKYDDFMSTWINTLHNGSMLRARWVRNNSSPLLIAAGWFCDEFSLSTYDPAGRNGKSFKIDKYVGPDNAARMTRLAVQR